MFSTSKKSPAPTREVGSNWTTTEDGELQLSSIRVYPTEDGCWDVQCDHNGDHGLSFVKFDKYVAVASIETNENNFKIASSIDIGDILVGINGRVVLHDDYADVIDLLSMLRIGTLPLRLKFLNPNRINLATYLENHDLSQKKNKDLYGFTRSIDYLNKEKSIVSQQSEFISNRDREWVEYLKSIGGPDNLKPAGRFRASNDLKLMCRRGIPAAYRPLVWQKISLSSHYRQRFPSDHYQALLRKALLELDKNVADDIEKDVDRTFPEHDYFCCGKGCTSLRRVLRAFAMQRPDIGYCQSLNFIAGMMLLFLDEEDTFWLFLTVVDTLLPGDYYTKSMVGIYVDQYVLTSILKKNLPRVSSAFEEAQLQLPIITVQWFLCLFLNTLRTEVALRVWDMFLNEGSKVLFRIAEALFQINEAKILAAQDHGELFKLLRDIGQSVTDADALISVAYGSHKPERRNSVGPIIASFPLLGYARTNFLNPRLSSSTSLRNTAIPSELNGVGLAHTGPRTGPDMPSLSRNLTDESGSGASTPVKFVTVRASSPCQQNATLEADLSNKATQIPPKQPKLFGLFATSTIKRADIEKWRNNFRPELEGRYQMMKVARESWREERKAKAGGEVEAVIEVEASVEIKTMAYVKDFEDDESECSDVDHTSDGAGVDDSLSLAAQEMLANIIDDATDAPQAALDADICDGRISPSCSQVPDRESLELSVGGIVDLEIEMLSGLLGQNENHAGRFVN